MNKTNSFTAAMCLSLFMYAHPILAQTIQHNLRVDGMTCPFCVASSSKALKKIDGVKTINADLKAGIIKVCVDKSTDMNDEMLTKLFLDKGFKYRQKETFEQCSLK